MWKSPSNEIMSIVNKRYLLSSRAEYRQPLRRETEILLILHSKQIHNVICSQEGLGNVSVGGSD